MTLKSHVESGGKKCPKCGSRAIKATDTPERRHKSTLWDHLFCATCGARWRNVYIHSKAENL